MVAALLGVFGREGLDGHVLVVDDNSPDGTGEIADELANSHTAVNVLHRRTKDGLGRAYLDGFAAALIAGADLVVQMDCDFSHDPDDVARLVDAAAHVDVAIGSRYVAGGAVENWSSSRRALSRAGCAYARLILGIAVRDLTGGFKCFRREALETLQLDTIQADGYGFQIETTYRACRLGLTIEELPIVFRDRTVGTSKMSWRIAAEALLLVPRLRTQAATNSRPAAPTRSNSTVAASTNRQPSDSAVPD
jgi:dolichol-phosphate mannosyltransferase